MRPLFLPIAILLTLTSFSALADDAPTPGDWSTQGGYFGLSGGFAHGRYDSDETDRNGDFNNHRNRYTDEASVDTGWQGTLESGAVIPLGPDWLRMRLGGEAGYGKYDLDTYRDGVSGDTVSGDFNLLRVGPAVALDFRIAHSPLSFSVGAGGGLAVVNLKSNVSNGALVNDSRDDHQTTYYLSGLASVNYALAPNLDLCLGVRAIWMHDVRIDGTPTLVGATPYSVRHEVPVTGAVELGLRWTF